MSVVRRGVTAYQRMRHAGARWTARAVCARAKKRVLGLPGLRELWDRALDVPLEALPDRIDYGACARGDYVGCFITRCGTQHVLDEAPATAARVARLFPDAHAKLIEQADGICANRFQFLGQDVAFGGEIDWFWAPDADRSWPVKHVDAFTKSEFMGQTAAADIKYPWELGRHQFWVTLGQAFAATGDERYAEAFTRQLLHWLEQNPLRQGIHWLSEMEFGIRLISWSNAFRLFRHSPYFQERALERFLHGLYLHATYLDRTLTTHWLVANNHLIGETAGLFAFGVLFPQFKEAARWRARALAVFTDALVSQVYPDGVNREQATGYHRFVLDFVLLVVDLAQRNGHKMPPVVLQRLEAMLEYERDIIAPDGTVPQIGDCDDGRGFVLSAAVPFFDFRGWQAVGAVLFDRADFARAAAGGNDEALWFLGPEGWDRYAAMVPEPAPRPSRLFRDGGHCVLRTGDGPGATYLFVRCGDFGLGSDGSCVHSHADMLAPVLHWQGRPFLADSGTYAYYCGTEVRDPFRGAAAHNALIPRGADQAEMFPIWNWGRVPRTRVLGFEGADVESRLDAELVSAEGYRHRRLFVLHRATPRLVIEDAWDVAPQWAHAPIDAFLHLMPGLSLRLEDGAGIVEGNALAPVRISWTGFNEAEVERYQHSPSYGVLHDAVRLRLAAPPGPGHGTIVIEPA